MEHILNLADERANLQNAGGKGASLARLAAAGFPVPGGFHITTDAYRAFVAENDLQDDILMILDGAEPSEPASLEIASRRVQELFAGGTIPTAVASDIVDAYATLPGTDPAVAVRSSATAEDLPQASFAGQQETYLNVSGAEDLLEAVKKCWASLWTARAIAYRARQGIPAQQVALAVVVQLLVPAEAAGVLFTVNPVSGNRQEMLISASWGLGEAVVSGTVTPDAIVVEQESYNIVSRETAEKAVMTVRHDGGTREEAVPANLRSVPVLSDEAASELARLGAQIQGLYGMPMDVEWAWRDGQFFILQARPITALPPGQAGFLPFSPEDWPLPEPKGRYMRTSIIDFMPDPLSPLFATMGLAVYNSAMTRMLEDITDAHNAPFPEELLVTINDYAYLKGNYTLREWWALLGRLAPRIKSLIANGPDHFRETALPQYRQEIRRLSERPVANMAATELWQNARDLTAAAMYHLAILQVDTLGAAAGSEGLFTTLYNRFFKREGDPPAPTFVMGYNSVPIRAEKSLFDLAQWCAEHPTLRSFLLQAHAGDIVDALDVEGAPGSVDSAAWSEFKERFDIQREAFGHILYDLDFATPIPADDPIPRLENVKMYLRGEGSDPYRRQGQLAERREEATAQLLQRARGLRGWAVRRALGWAQAIGQVREDSVASIGLAYPRLREALQELGRRMVETGAITHSPDIFWLQDSEIEERLAAVARGERLDSMQAIVDHRREIQQAEMKIVPPPQLPPSKSYMGIPVELFTPTVSGHEADRLKGVAASGGRMTGAACVLHGPEDFDQMQQGGILVAKLTTPAWTPLFAMAGAVVTDIGGPLSHGSIVAREYGIPAVLGTGVATRRIQNGTEITVDGDEGVVILSQDGDVQAISAQTVSELELADEWNLPKGSYMAMRNNIVELMADPLSPLFATLGRQAINRSMNRLLAQFFGRSGILPQEPIIVVNHYAYYDGSLSALNMGRILFGSIGIARRMFSGAVERWTEVGRPRYVQTVKSWQDRPWRQLPSAEILEGACQLSEAAIDAYGALVSGVIPAAWISEALFTTVHRITVRGDNVPAQAYLMGFETTPIRADKCLYDLAQWARSHEALASYLLHTPTAQIAAQLDANDVPQDLATGVWQAWQSRFAAHLRQYGHMIYNLDFANPVPADDPRPLLEACKYYLLDQGASPHERQQEMAVRREEATEATLQRLRGLRLKLFRKFLSPARRFAPMREDGLAEVGLAYPLVRQMLLELGRRLSDAGMLGVASDIFWLEQGEVVKATGRLEHESHVPSSAELVENRKGLWQAAARLSPPLGLMRFLGRTRKIDKRGRRRDEHRLKGVACSPGKVTGPARVLHHPGEFGQLQPGEILVASITTPAWTPLFALAAAIVTDVGGPLSHGSIVAREVGIPAVLGTGAATKVIQSGQTITVDGSSGMVFLSNGKR